MPNLLIGGSSSVQSPGTRSYINLVSLLRRCVVQIEVARVLPVQYYCLFHIENELKPNDVTSALQIEAKTQHLGLDSCGNAYRFPIELETLRRACSHSQANGMGPRFLLLRDGYHNGSNAENAGDSGVHCQNKLDFPIGERHVSQSRLYLERHR